MTHTGSTDSSNLLDKAANSASSALSALAAVAIIFVAASTTFEIIMRYFFNAPTTWVFNFSTVMVANMTLMGAAWTLRKGKHIRVDVITNMLPKRSKLAMEVISDGFIAAFAAIVAYMSLGMVLKAYAVHMRVVTVLPIPEWPFRVPFFVGAALLCIVALVQAISKARKTWSVSGGWQPGDGSTINSIASVIVFVAALILALLIMKFAGLITGIIIVLVVLLFGGISIFAGMGFVGVFALIMFGSPLSEVARVSWYVLNHYALVCLPLFMVGGQLLQQGTTGVQLYDVGKKWFGHLPGGLGIATIAACAIFSAVSGSSVATAATIGLISIPAMLAGGYDKPISYGAAAGGGLLGIMIPPSAAMIVYSGLTNEPIADLFIAGVFPGIFMAVMFATYIFLVSLRKHDMARQEPASWKERFNSLKGVIGPVGAVAIVFGGIYSGIFTAIEASAVFVVYVVIMIFATKAMNFRTAVDSLASATENSVMIMIIISGASILGLVITLSGLPQMLTAFVTGMQLQQFAVIMLIMLVWIIMGCFMEGLAMQLITVPVFYPLIINMGINGVWFGILLVVAIEMALITPPVGLNIFVIQGITSAKSSEVIRGVIPYVFMLLIMVPILYFFPQIALWLPNTMK